MASLVWYRKVYWITQREFPRWLFSWDPIWMVVVGYSGIARKNIDILKQGYPDLNVERREFLL